MPLNPRFMEAFSFLYPLADPQTDVVIQDGAITEWNLIVPQLTDDQVTAALAIIDAPPLPPRLISPLQARRALTQAGLRDAVESYVTSQSQDVQDAWHYATEIERTDPTLGAAATALGMTSAQLDALFVAAAAL